LAPTSRSTAFENAYEALHLAAPYGSLEFPGTYHLVYRDLLALF
jgi:hypothetical protein